MNNPYNTINKSFIVHVLNIINNAYNKIIIKRKSILTKYLIEYLLKLIFKIGILYILVVYVINGFNISKVNLGVY